MSKCNFVDEESIDLSSVPINSEEIEVRLDSLHEIDLRIIELLEAASKSLSLMTEATKKPSSPINTAESKATFEKSSQSYFELLEEVSVSLRKEIKLLNEVSKDKVLPISVDAKAEWVGKAKESEIYTHIDTLLDIKNRIILEEGKMKEKEAPNTEVKIMSVEDTDIKMEDIDSKIINVQPENTGNNDIEMENTQIENNAKRTETETTEMEIDTTGNFNEDLNPQNIKAESPGQDKTEKVQVGNENSEEEKAFGTDYKEFTHDLKRTESTVEPVANVETIEQVTEIASTESATEKENASDEKTMTANTISGSPKPTGLDNGTDGNSNVKETFENNTIIDSSNGNLDEEGISGGISDEENAPNTKEKEEENENYNNI
ncbi:hypothetical protein NADFUDRAFT_49089 [Nadsonia fulvescens var. elongata DSM 6958]|uniref:Mediator of RNA polymerase II transcription subunit 11 n=1 Tax=Nadsonia fulvescens var. elongata DSM 6958 TaxID=857566 RepID=A0A1E3PSQ5_9ASCO|nr:hypothetical protein NADFUDRAFT_49089 [Nadsonia fulvescens var. elongata DSM 6958]